MRSAFTGAFAPYICGLIEKKQALGYDYHGSACILRTFDEFCREQFPNETCLTAELAMKWAEQFKTEKNLSRLNMNYSSKNTISQQKADGPSDFLGITQSSGLDHLSGYPDK